LAPFFFARLRQIDDLLLVWFHLILSHRIIYLLNRDFIQFHSLCTVPPRFRSSAS
jgi:hypothetical protein